MSAPTLRWGLLSTARINDALLGADPSKPERWQAVASRDATRARAYADEKEIARSHGSYEALLADPLVDAVYIGLPNALHAPWALKALEAGKHVLVEKPFARRPEAVEECYDAAEARGLVLAEAFMWRHHPQARRARQLIVDGAIGELRSLHATFSFALTDPENVRWSAELEGGALMDIGCYCLSGCRTLAGTEPVRVHGESVTTPDGVDVSFSGLIRFAHDVRATFDCSFAAVPRHSLEAIGTDGRLRLDDPWHGRRPVISLTGADGATSDVDCSSTQGSYALELEDFEAAVAGDRAPLLGREDAMRQARTIAALYASAATNEGVTP